MKIMINTLSKRFLLLCLFLVSLSGYSQSTLSVTLANGSSTSNTFEFDLMLVVTAPTAGVVINAVTAGVEYNTGILNGGTPCTTANCGSVTLIAGTAAPELTGVGLSAYTLTNRASPAGHLRLVQAPNSASTASVLPGTYRVGRFRFTNTVNWTASSNANLWLKPTNTNPVGSTNTLVSAEPAGQGTQVSFSTTVGTPPLTLGFTSASTFSIPLNFPSCPTAAAASGLVAESPCAGAANGSAVITLTGAPNNSSAVTYTVDGGATQNATLSSGAFTVNGLSAGSHVVAVTYPTCSAVSTSSFSIGAGTALTTNGSVTTSICDGDTYVWPANGQSYTTAQSGVTFVDGCNTATLNLTVNPSTTTGSESQSICGSSYNWPTSGQTYNESGSYPFVSGCNTATLTLVLTPSTTNGGLTTSACDTFTWTGALASGDTYTTSGTYTHVTGCNTATLILTITPSTTTGSVTTSICDGATYVWPANGQSYTTAQSGVTFVSGCNTATLNLTVTPATTNGSDTVTACGSYTWTGEFASGSTYTTSGTYTHVTGCNTATLNLTINSSAQTFYADTDGDNFGAGAPILSCTGQPEGTSTNNTDCAPTDPSRWRTGTFFVDADNDGYNNGFPSSSVCYGATTPSGFVAVNNGVDCNEESASVNPNASEIAGNSIDDNCDGTSDEVTPLSSLVPASCGATLTNLQSTIFAYQLPSSPVLGAIQGYRFRVTNGATVRTIDRPSNSFNLSQLAGGATYATTYTVEVSVKSNGFFRAYGAPCTVTTPAIPNSTILSSSSCGSTLANISSSIFCVQVPSASGYRFRVRNGATVVGTVDKTVNRFSLVDLGISNIAFATTYTVDVLLAFGGQFRPESEYGSACSISTPATPGRSRVIAPSCGSTITSRWTNIYAQQVLGAQGYKFVVTNGAQTREFVTANSRFQLQQLSGGAAASTAYTIRVDVLYNSSYVEGTVLCTITTSAGMTRQTDAALAIYEVNAYPNPYAETFKLNVNTSSEDQVGVRVYDMLGREVEARQASVAAITNLEIGSQYPSGVYNIIVTQGDNVKTVRVVKR